MFHTIKPNRHEAEVLAGLNPDEQGSGLVDAEAAAVAPELAVYFELSRDKSGYDINDTAVLTAIVIDQNGNPIPGVRVTLTNSVTMPLTSISSEIGRFRFPNLRPARDYKLRARLEGSDTWTRSNIIVRAGKRVMAVG